MRKQNDIDQLFESKINNQAFELKDAYLANFESQLDVYNKKGKGLLWIVFGSLIAFTLLYDFVLLPKQNTNAVYKITTVKATDFNIENIEDNYQNLNGSNKEVNYLNATPSNKNAKEEPYSKKQIDRSNTTSSPKTSNNSVSNKNTTPIKSRTEIGKDLKKEPVQSSFTTLKKAIFNTKDTSNLTEKKIETIKTPDVYLDDTIRRQVIIIDTIVKRDTIIINDTIKNKIRLFKKKR